MEISDQFLKELKHALGRAAEANNLPIPQTRIQIRVLADGEAAKYFILNGNVEVGEMPLRKLLGIGLVDILNKEPQVASFLNIGIAMLAFKNKINILDANIRIYSKNEDGSDPLIAFLDKDAIVIRPTVSDLMDLYQDYVENFHDKSQEQAKETEK